MTTISEAEIQITEGILLLELRPRYSAYLEEALQETRRLLKECCVE